MHLPSASYLATLLRCEREDEWNDASLGLVYHTMCLNIRRSGKEVEENRQWPGFLQHDQQQNNDRDDQDAAETIAPHFYEFDIDFDVLQSCVVRVGL